MASRGAIALRPVLYPQSSKLLKDVLISDYVNADLISDPDVTSGPVFNKPIPKLNVVGDASLDDGALIDDGVCKNCADMDLQWSAEILRDFQELSAT
jgi:hypothetical protein